MNNITTQEWYGAMLDDIKSCLTERIHAAREEVILAHWEVGKRIGEEKERLESYGSSYCKRISQDLGVGLSTIYFCLNFAERVPELESPPEEYQKFLSKYGKNNSWHKVVHEFLSPPKTKEDLGICPTCKRKLTKKI